MAKKLLKRTEQHYADSYEEAAEIVAEAKQQEELTMQKINEKHNSKGFYFLVDTQFTYSTPKEEMDKRPNKDDAPDGQLTIDEVAADPVDDLSDIEFKEIPDEKVTEENIPF